MAIHPPARRSVDTSDDGTTAAGRPLVFGEVLFDYFADGSRVLGGAPFNVAWHLRGFGADPLLISAVGVDEDGREVLSRMESWGLDTSGVQHDSLHRTGRVMATIVDREPAFEIGQDQAWDFVRREPVLELLGRSDVDLLYHGTLALRSERNWPLVRSLVRAVKAPTLVDLNLRPPWWTQDRVRWCLRTADWVKMNDAELAAMSGLPVHGLDECRDAALDLAGRYTITHLLVTRGEKGSLAVEDGRVHRSLPEDVSDLVDTVGAGDAFSAVACLGVLRGWHPQTIMDRAGRFAADICRIQGATTSDRSLYERHLERWDETGAADAPGAADEGGSGALHLMSISVHGLVRGTDIEMGRDPDTGGQVSYVIDQARALAEHPDVGRVQVVTRAVQDRNVSDDYARPREEIADGAAIVRIPFGPRRYLRKESLWPHLDGLLDELTRHVREHGVPDAIHGHYADAGYVGARLASVLGVPFIFTGHSLGRVKRARLAGTADEEELENRYHFSQRIEAEERALETAALVITSTNQEVAEQYESYDYYQPDRMVVIPPGVDLSRFSPPPRGRWRPPIASELERFLRDPGKPMVLSIARPDDRKNFDGLIQAFGENRRLRDTANLVLVAGTRDDLEDMPAAGRRVLRKILALIDRYDLYGSVAYPKTHDQEDIPDLYRLAARSRGVFVNPALTEPFGLTLLEAAASGLPVAATNDGGPRDILFNCRNGLLFDPKDPEAMGATILDALGQRGRWKEWSRNGLEAVHDVFSWSSHASRYVEELHRVRGGERPAPVPTEPTRLTRIDRLLVTDLDDTLIGDEDALNEFLARLASAGDHVGFAIATGRTLESVLEVLRRPELPRPDVLITAGGTEIHYGPDLKRDESWDRQVRYRWDRDRVEEAASELPGLHMGPPEHQTELRLSFLLDPEHAPAQGAVRRRLRQAGLRVNTIVDHEIHLDVLPVRASPGLALRFFMFKWNLEPERLMVAGDSGNDAETLSGRSLGVVVANHTPELDVLKGRPRVYFSREPYARGILEGVEHYDFFGDIDIPETEGE